MWPGLPWFLMLSRAMCSLGNEDVTGSPGGFHPKGTEGGAGGYIDLAIGCITEGLRRNRTH